MEQNVPVSEVMPVMAPAAQNLLLLIKQLVKEEQFEGVALLFTSEMEGERNAVCMQDIGIELLHDVCLEHLTSTTYEQNAPLYGCADELLKIIAMHGPGEEVLLELLELVEERKSEVVFTTTLRALQEVLKRLSPQKPHALDWTLSSIHNHFDELPVPEYLKEGYDENQERLLEQDDQLQCLLMQYISVGMFYEPILQEVMLKDRLVENTFRDCSITPRNVLCCFMVKMLGKPLALMDITINDDHKTNTYTAQCVQNFAKDVTNCLGSNPFFLLSLVEQRVRWTEDSTNLELAEKNVFLNEHKLPLHALAIYFYLVLVERVSADKLPKVYCPLYIYETVMYLATHLLHQPEPPLQYRGLLLAQRLLELLNQTLVPAVCLELEMHKDFCSALCSIMSFSPLLHLRQLGVKLLRKYILQFDDVGKYLVLKNMLHTVTHNGIAGYLATMYKDIVAKALLAPDAPLPASFCGPDFRAIFLQDICRLSRDVETDLVEESDKVIAALNAVRFFAITDKTNRTGFWNFSRNIDCQFLSPLRVALDMSNAHYKAELKRVVEGSDDDVDEMKAREQLKLLDLAVGNDGSAQNPLWNLNVDREQKIEILKQDAHNSFLACASYASRAMTLGQMHNASCTPPQLASAPHQLRYYCSIINDDNKSGSLDEFRAREHQREEEFARKQAEENTRSRANADDEAKKAKSNAIRHQILEAALLHVPTLGWSRKAIVQGAEDAGLPSVVHGIFPEGGFALVSHFNGKCNTALVKQLQAETQNGQKQVQNPLEFLVAAVRQRLAMISPYKGQWPQALALIALPQNATTALAQVLTVVDDICYYSGDRSVDFGWYTRRIGLATIMKMTELYMLQDTSPNHAKTWEFLQNRMDEAVQLQMMLAQTGGVKNSVQQSFNSAFVTARNILGLNYGRR